MDDSVRCRNRARECRELAKGARDDYSRAALNSIAFDLDAEAEQLEADKARRKDA